MDRRGRTGPLNHEDWNEESDESDTELRPFVVNREHSQEGAAAPVVVIQHGERNEANFNRPNEGSVTQVGQENIINICTETQTFRIKVISKQKNVDAVVAINMVLPEEDLDRTRTLVLGRETTQEQFSAGEELIVRIESDKVTKRRASRRNGYTYDCHLRSITRDVLTSLFERVNMMVNYFRDGSIVVGLKPRTDRALFTLLNAMDEGFIQELVQGVLEHEPDWNIDDDSDEPLKLKIDINVPHGMFPKEFPRKKFANRKELLQELTVTLQRKEREEIKERLEKKMESRKASPDLSTKERTSQPRMPLNELVKQLVARSEEELLTRMNTVKTIRNVAKEVKNIQTLSTVATGATGTGILAGLILAPFTAGLSLIASAGAAGLNVLASVLASTQRVMKKNKAQEQFIKYDIVLGRLFESLTLLVDSNDKDDIGKALNEFLRKSHKNASDNNTLRVILNDIHGFQLGAMFMVPFKGKMVSLKDLEVMDYVNMFLRRSEDVSNLHQSLQKLADDLEAYEVVTSRRVHAGVN